MVHSVKIVLGTAMLVLLAGCVEDTGGGGGGGSVTAAAESACLSRARASSVRDPYVISSEFSEANTLVTVGGSQGDRYRCLSSNSGVVAEFSLM